MTRFILSCTTCALRAPGKDEILETLRHAPAAGFKYWGLAGPVFWTSGVAQWVDAEKIRRLQVEAGLVGLTEVYAPPIPTESPAAAARYVRNSLVYSCALAESLGSPLVVLSGGRRTEGSSGLDASAAGIEALVPLVSGLRVRVALEPHFHSQYQDAADYDYILSRVDSAKIGITIDTGHFHSARVDTRAFINRHGSRIWNVHLKDHIGTQSVPIGQGEIDLRGILRELDAVGYEGALALEIEPEDPDSLPRYVREAYVYLRELLREVLGGRFGRSVE